MGHRRRETDIQLKRAVNNGSFDAVFGIVSQYGPPSSPAWSESMLCLALNNGRADIARYLLKIGLPLESGDHATTTVRQNTPLHLAISRGYSSVAKMLLNRCTSVNAQGASGGTPLHLAVISQFSDGGQNDVIQCLLDRGASVNALNLRGMTPLHEACKQRSLSIVTRLVAKGASIHSEVSPVMVEFPLFTPLHFAIGSSSACIARYLIQRGAHVKIEGKDSPLKVAVNTADISMIQMLLEIEPVLLRGEFPVLLNLAVWNGHCEIAEYLLENGAGINPTGILHPLHIAAAAGSAVFCEFLLKRGADVEAKQTLKVCEVQKQLIYLNSHGRHARELTLSGCGKTALHFAAENRREKVVALLLQFGAHVDSADENGRTVLHLACSRIPPPLVATVQNLLDYGSDVNIVNKSGKTVFDDQGSSLNARYQASRQYTVVKRVFSHHAVKMRLAGFCVEEQKLQSAESFPEFRAECEKEMALLRSDGIVENCAISFNMIFKMTLNEVAGLTRADGVAKVLNSEEFKQKYPVYANVLRAKFLKGVSRAKLLDVVPLMFYEDQVLYLPYICVKRIFDYLGDEDLKKLNDACKPLLA